MAGPAAAAASPHGTFRIARSGHPAHRPGHPAAQPRRAARRTALPHRIPSAGLAAVHRVRRQLRAADRADAARRPAPGGRCGRRLRRTRGEHAACVTRRGRGGRGGRRPGGGRGSALRRPATARGAGGGRGGGPDGPRRARAVAHLGGGDRCRRGLGLLRRVRLPRSRARRGHHPVRRHRGRRRSRGPRRPRASWRSSSRRRHRAASAAAHGCSPAPSTPARPDVLGHRGRRATAGPTTRAGATPVPRTDRARTRGERARGRRGGAVVPRRRAGRRARAGLVRPGGARRGTGPLRRARTRTGPSTCGPRSSGRRRIRRPPSPRRCSPPARCCAATERWPGSRWTGRSRRGPGTGSPGCCARSGRRACRRNVSASASARHRAAAMPVRRVAGRSKRRSRR